jgi:hypothetical protein
MSLSYATVVVCAFRLLKLSRLWIAPALIVFSIALCASGTSITNLWCARGNDFSVTYAHLFQRPIGKFLYNEGLLPDSLAHHRYDGRLVGVHFQSGTLTIYRINAEPVRLRTGFLLWQIDSELFREDLYYYGLGTFTTSTDSSMEMIGGKDMPLEAFLAELRQPTGRVSKRIADKQVLNASDGTTRLRVNYSER